MFRCCFFFLCLIRTPLIYSLFPYTTLFRSGAILLGSVMVINFILAFTVIFLERKNASSTWAWIMVLFFIPILGFILYLIFGRKLNNRYKFKWDKKKTYCLKRNSNSIIKKRKHYIYI